MSELYHYGIKGMRWGVRRSDAELARLSGYKSDINSLVKQRRQVTKKLNAYSEQIVNGVKRPTVVSKFNSLDSERKRISSEIDKLEVARYREFPPSKTYSIPDKKSSRRVNIEQSFQSRGYTKSESEQLAARKIRTEKLVAGIAATAITGYVVSKIAKKYIGKTLKAGGSMATITSFEDRIGSKDGSPFYAANGRLDKIKYRGLLGAQQLNKHGQLYSIKTKLTSDIKMPSEKEATSVLASLWSNDSNFAKQASARLTEMKTALPDESKLGKLYTKALRDVQNGKITSNVYDAFNVGLVSPDGKPTEAANTFYKTLSSKGFGAIQDVNDMKYSGYGSKNPMIVFDMASVVKNSVDKLDKSDIATDKGIAGVVVYGREFLKQAGIIGGVGVVATAVGNRQVESRITDAQKIVNQDKRKEGE